MPEEAIQVVPPSPPVNVAEYTPFAPEIEAIIHGILEDDERQPSQEPNYPVNRIFSSGESMSGSSALTTPLEPSTAEFHLTASFPPAALAPSTKKPKKPRQVATRIITPIEIPSDDESEIPLPTMKPRHVSTNKDEGGMKVARNKTKQKARSTKGKALGKPTQPSNTQDNVQEQMLPGEHEIFSDVGDFEKSDVLIWIASHEFMQKPIQPASRSARCQFVDELGRIAKAAGLRDASISMLIVYVRWTYLNVVGLSDSEIKGFADCDAFGEEFDTPKTTESSTLSKTSHTKKRRRSTLSDPVSKRPKFESPGSESSFHTANEDSDSIMLNDAESPPRNKSPMDISSIEFNSKVSNFPDQPDESDELPIPKPSLAKQTNNHKRQSQQLSSPAHQVDVSKENTSDKQLEVDLPLDNKRTSNAKSVIFQSSSIIESITDENLVDPLSPTNRKTPSQRCTPLGTSEKKPGRNILEEIPSQQITYGTQKTPAQGYSSPAKNTGEVRESLVYEIPSSPSPPQSPSASQNTCRRLFSPFDPAANTASEKDIQKTTQTSLLPSPQKIKHFSIPTLSPADVGSDSSEIHKLPSARKRRRSSSVHFADEIGGQIAQEIPDLSINPISPVTNDHQTRSPVQKSGSISIAPEPIVTVYPEQHSPVDSPTQETDTVATEDPEDELTALPVALEPGSPLVGQDLQKKTSSAEALASERAARKRAKKMARDEKRRQKKERKEARHQERKALRRLKHKKRHSKNANDGTDLDAQIIRAVELRAQSKKTKNDKKHKKTEKASEVSQNQKEEARHEGHKKELTERKKKKKKKDRHEHLQTLDKDEPHHVDAAKASHIQRATTPDNDMPSQMPQTPSTGQSRKSMYSPVSPNPDEWSMDF